MSRQSGIQVDGSARTVAGLGARAVQKPLMKESLDFFIAGFGMIPPEVLAHQIETGLKQIERRSERLRYRRRRR